MSISTEFRQSIKPLIMINSIFATGLLEYYDESKAHIIGYIYALFSLISYSVIFYVIMYVLEFYTKNRSFMLQVTFIIHTHSHILFHTYTLVFGILRRKEIKCVLTQLESCIGAMEELGIPRNYSKYHRYLWYLITSLFINLFSIVLVNYIWDITPDYNYFIITFSSLFQHYPFVVVSTAELSFLYWILCITLRFSELNAVLKEMLTTTSDSPQHKRVLRMRNSRKDNSPSRDIHQTYQMNADIKKIKKIKEIHLELIKCARITNTAYSLHILFSMTSAFILLTTLYYNVYNLLFVINTKKTLDYLGFGAWIFYFSLKIVITSHMCSKTVAEIRDFTQQLIQNPLVFTACGFFDLDHTFIRGVIGTVTTYLVILIQVGSAPLKFYIGNGTFPE